MKIQPPATLLCGFAGSGKTSSIATMAKAGIETFVIVTEPDGAASLIDAAERIKAPLDLIHWHECLPFNEGWAQLEDMISKVNSMDQKELSNQVDMGKSGFRPAAMKLLRSFQNFHCDRTGKDYGDVSTWDATRCLAMDSFTGWCQIGWGAAVGYKPTASQGEWGIAQNFVLNMLRKVLADRQSYFIMTSHPEKEMDDITGARRLMVSAIGAKLAPKIPVLFSEVVLASKKGNVFNWATLDTGMELKNRALPNSAEIKPDFAQIVAAHERRIESSLASLTVVAPPSATPVTTPRLTPPAAPLSPAKTVQ